MFLPNFYIKEMLVGTCLRYAYDFKKSMFEPLVVNLVDIENSWLELDFKLNRKKYTYYQN